MEVLSNVSLRPYNTFGIDVSARWFANVKSDEELRALLTDTSFESSLRLILGGGSNLLFTRPVNGLVVKMDFMGRHIVAEDENHAVIEAGAGENWHELVRWSISQKLGGLENLSLIPGNVGASPMQNIGAYGVEIKDCFHSLDAIELASGDLRTFTAAECAFAYRESVFKRALRDQYAIVRVRYTLSKKPTFNISYGAIEQELEKMGVQELTLDAVSQAVINIRQSKLPDPKVLGNAGSFFKNPVVSESDFERIKAEHPDAPHYPAPGGVKLAAGWLIEQCGWKGKRVGNCGMHQKQALVLVNYGGASGEELHAHALRVQQSVLDKFGVKMEQEVNLV
ncbi:MAG: UDP-N-acetylmuramate dehydrogenase [Cryomorphaceae bacterium]|nr:MAG: UDP-N-acetylmuramate dehydrogenase [Cryomorphaceae bacterium]